MLPPVKMHLGILGFQSDSLLPKLISHGLVKGGGLPLYHLRMGSIFRWNVVALMIRIGTCNYQGM